MKSRIMLATAFGVSLLCSGLALAQNGGGAAARRAAGRNGDKQRCHGKHE